MENYRIGISGKMRSGKDTVAAYLRENYGFVRMAIADKLKEVAKDLFGMRETEKNRELLQALGRKMCDIDKAVWAKYILDRIPLSGPPIVITDLRFPTEYHALRALGFTFVRMSISRQTQLERLDLTEMDTAQSARLEEIMNDPSETALDGPWKWHYTIDGSGSLDRTHAQVDIMMREITK